MSCPMIYLHTTLAETGIQEFKEDSTTAFAFFFSFFFAKVGGKALIF